MLLLALWAGRFHLFFFLLMRFWKSLGFSELHSAAGGGGRARLSSARLNPVRKTSVIFCRHTPFRNNVEQLEGRRLFSCCGPFGMDCMKCAGKLLLQCVGRHVVLCIPAGQRRRGAGVLQCSSWQLCPGCSASCHTSWSQSGRGLG